jgi:hypothetical protein
MNSWGNDYSETDGQPNNNDNGSGGGLRQFATQVQQENKALKDQLAAIQKRLDSQAVQSVFDSAGVPGAAALYQGDADPAKVNEWITTMKSAFGASGGNPSTSTVPAEPALSPEQQAQMQRMNEAGAAGTPLTSMEQALNNAGQVGNVNDLIANFQAAQRSLGG